MSKLKIHLVIGAYRFPMSIERDEEEIYRNAEKQVNKYVEDYQKHYQLISGEEILSLVSLRLAVVIFKIKMNQDIEPVIEKIQSLDDELKQLLGNE